MLQQPRPLVPFTFPRRVFQAAAQYLLNVEFSTDKAPPVTGSYAGEVGSITISDPQQIYAIAAGRAAPQSNVTTSSEPNTPFAFDDTARDWEGGLLFAVKARLPSTLSATAYQWRPGWGSSNGGNGSTDSYSFRLQDNGSHGIQDGANINIGVLLPTISLDTEYVFSFLLFEDGGFAAFVNGALVWMGLKAAVAQVYAGFSNNASTPAIVGDVDYLKVRVLESITDRADLASYISDTPYSKDAANVPFADQDMEGANVGDGWQQVAGFNQTLSKQTGTPHGGARVLRQARSSTNNPVFEQNADMSINVGDFLLLEGYARSDGSARPTMNDNANAAWWIGAISTAWQNWRMSNYVKSKRPCRAVNATTTGTQYCEWDDFKATRLNPTLHELPAADGILELDFTYPASPTHDSKLCIEVRRVSDGEKWMLILRRNSSNSQWDLQGQSITGGTITERGSATNIGSRNMLTVALFGGIKQFRAGLKGQAAGGWGTTINQSVSFNNAETTIGIIATDDFTVGQLRFFSRESDLYDVMDGVID